MFDLVMMPECFYYRSTKTSQLLHSVFSLNSQKPEEFMCVAHTDSFPVVWFALLVKEEVHVQVVFTLISAALLVHFD